jgi:hypothetical protein
LQLDIAAGAGLDGGDIVVGAELRADQSREAGGRCNLGLESASGGSAVRLRMATPLLVELTEVLPLPTDQAPMSCCQIPARLPPPKASESAKA